MYYTFSAERKVAFTIMAGGIRRLVEFGDRNVNGASSFMTHDPKVAMAIRKHSMSRRGVIVETTPEQKEEPVAEAPKPQPRTLGTVKGVTPNPSTIKPKPVQTVKPAVTKPAAKAAAIKDEPEPTGEVREYANFTVAKDAIAKEFQVPKTKLLKPTALA